MYQYIIYDGIFRNILSKKWCFQTCLSNSNLQIRCFSGGTIKYVGQQVVGNLGFLPFEHDFTIKELPNIFYIRFVFFALFIVDYNVS